MSLLSEQNAGFKKKCLYLGKIQFLGTFYFTKPYKDTKNVFPLLKFSLSIGNICQLDECTVIKTEGPSHFLSLPIRSKRPGRFLVRTHGRCVGIGIQRYQKPPPVLLGRRNSEAVEPNREKPLH